MNPLDQLNDIHLTETASFWPPAYGWWILMLFTLVSLVFLTRWTLQRKRARIAKRQAIDELQLIKENGDVQQINILLKRVCISYFDKSEIAQLHGEAWVAFLLSHLGEKKAEELKPKLSQLVDAPYRDVKEYELDSCLDAATQWVKTALPPKKQRTRAAKGAAHV